MKPWASAFCAAFAAVAGADSDRKAARMRATVSAMAVMWPLGDCLPPTAVVGRAVVMELDYKGRYYGEFLKACLVPAALISLLATLFLVFSKNLAFLVGG